MYVVLMNNFLLFDSNKLSNIIPYFGLLSPKTLDCKFLNMMCVVYIKNLALADYTNLRPLGSFKPFDFQLYRHRILRVQRPLGSFKPPKPENNWFQRFRHHVRRFREKFSSSRFKQIHEHQAHFELLSLKSFDSKFQDMACFVYIKI